jgi:hypothetical protein
MTRNRVFVGIIAVLVVLGLSIAASAQSGKELGVGKTRTVTFLEAVKVQGQTLPAGEYSVQHVMEGQNHIMVFSRMPEKQQTFRFACNMVKLPAKAKQTSNVIDISSGTRVLKAIVFAGDTYEHQFGD